MAHLRVKEIAEGQGLDPVELARISRVAYSVVLRIWRNPNYNATVETLNALAQALHVEVGELFAKNDGKKS